MYPAKHLAFLLVLLVAFSSKAFCQEDIKKLDPANFKEETLSALIVEKINAVRTAKGLPALTTSPALKKAAQIQATYLKRKNKLTHFENTKKLKTPFDRVNQLDKSFTQVAENVAYVSPGLIILRGKRVEEIRYFTYDTIASQLVNDWIKSPGHYKNIISNFSQTGVAVSLNLKAQRLFAVQVFGGKAKTPKEKHPPIKNHLKQQ